MDARHHKATHRHQRLVHSDHRLSLCFILVLGIQCVQVGKYGTLYKDPRW
jgi:hypothetical protein